MNLFEKNFLNKRVLITGHTGFKGAWLTEWLLMLGAEVKGFSNCVYEGTSLFSSLNHIKRIKHSIGDIRDTIEIENIILDFQPDFVFHLAAQPLVRLSYREPLETMTTNIIGTANLLNALRKLKNLCSCVIVTSDKCYENIETLHGYREYDSLGGFDPYSASKGAAEIVAHSFRRSYFLAGGNVRIATARAGNVIGGGDWAEDRIIPDCVRSLLKSEKISIRNPNSTRPWQHVLDPLSGYLWLALVLSEQVNIGIGDLNKVDTFNFGPGLQNNRDVKTLVTTFLSEWPGEWCAESNIKNLHEASLLNLSIDKAYHMLKWKPIWGFEKCVFETASWYRNILLNLSEPSQFTKSNIKSYMVDAANFDVFWASEF